jgi:hypothetical protein
VSPQLIYTVGEITIVLLIMGAAFGVLIGVQVLCDHFSGPSRRARADAKWYLNLSAEYRARVYARKQGT